MNRIVFGSSRVVLPAMATGMSLMGLNAQCAELNPEENPNIILIVADDHGMDAVGCYGNPVIKTPALDSLAQVGSRFTNAYCTSASSAASRAVLLTGMYGHSTGVYGHTHDYHHFSAYDNVRSLPVMLEENGYYTACVGKYHLAPASVYPFNKTFKANPRNTVEMAQKSAETFKSDKPFFLYFCPDDPHRSAAKDDNWETPNPFGNVDGGVAGVTTISYDPNDVIVPPFLPDTKYCREEIAQYYESISRVDQGVGYLLNELRKSGKADNTIVIYISDNGMAFPGAKTTTYEPGLNLPCIISVPGEKLREVNDAMITWGDITPTLLELVGIDASKETFHGRSFAETLPQGSTSEGWDNMYASHTFHEITMYYPMRVHRKGDMKLIWNAAWQLPYPFASDLWASSTWQGIYRSGAEKYGERTVDAFLNRAEFELYDLKNDPGESVNLAGDKRYEKVLDEMLTELKDWQQKTKDPWYILWSNDASMQGSGVNL